MTCDQSENIIRYFDGELVDAERATVEAHLQSCEPCQELLADLRGLSQLIHEAPLAPITGAATARHYAAWNRAARTGVLKMASWLSGVAAAAMIAGLLWPVHAPRQTAAPRSVPLQAIALMPSMTPESGNERTDDLVQMAQWMADDLADGPAAGGR